MVECEDCRLYLEYTKKAHKLMMSCFAKEKFFIVFFLLFVVLSGMINAINLTTFLAVWIQKKVIPLLLFSLWGQREEDKTQIKKIYLSLRKKITNSRWVHSWTAAFIWKPIKFCISHCVLHLHILFMYIIQKELIIQSFIWEKITNYKEKLP